MQSCPLFAKLPHTVLVNPPLRGFSFMASFDKAAFEKKAFKFVPYLILGKIIFAAWFISYLVKL
ncbi:hypothetical protein DNJ72_05820 [Prochlorococcus marinus XMU1403]|nr:hypothetical protein [Prochlorococcus marinus str. MU1403]PYE01483.1 hypothetical protein DNJ72_05820 [Prochlorococcus marinus XMU1403]